MPTYCYCRQDGEGQAHISGKDVSETRELRQVRACADLSSTIFAVDYRRRRRGQFDQTLGL